jgi:hypothetical protein
MFSQVVKSYWRKAFRRGNALISTDTFTVVLSSELEVHENVMLWRAVDGSK